MIVLVTLGRRAYAIGFIVLFFWAAIPAIGWKRLLRFAVVASVVQLAAELSSTRNGFPFGRYAYDAVRTSSELRISNVPVFVPLSFGVMVWAGRELARAALPKANAWALVIPGAIGAVVLDLIVDPMSLRGEQWFMGPLYRYEHSSFWFGVPWTNAAGWLLVSAILLAVDAVLGGAEKPSRRGLALPGYIAGFFVVLALATAQWAIVGATLAVVSAVATVILLVRRARPAGARSLRPSP